MNRSPQSAIFLERSSYRQRRLRDAARLVPVIGSVLLMIPLLWPADPEHGPNGASALIYIFGVWAFLILTTALITFFLRHDDIPADEGNAD